jgi:hypothetical protein
VRSRSSCFIRWSRSRSTLRTGSTTLRSIPARAVERERVALSVPKSQLNPCAQARSGRPLIRSRRRSRRCRKMIASIRPPPPDNGCRRERSGLVDPEDRALRIQHEQAGRASLPGEILQHLQVRGGVSRIG